MKAIWLLLSLPCAVSAAAMASGAGVMASSGASCSESVNAAPQLQWKPRNKACYAPNLPLSCSNPRAPLKVCGVPRARYAAASNVCMTHSDGRMQRRDVLAGAFALNVAGCFVPDVFAEQAQDLISDASNMPLSRNQLDAGASYILSQEQALIGEEDLRDDMIFTFRGEQMVKTNSEGALRYLSRRNAVFFGESHDSFKDKKLATRILKELHERRGRVVVGLEMVQQPFQQVLDWYVFSAVPSKGSDSLLFEKTEWNDRWGWNFKAYLPVLQYCQLHKIPLLALNVEAETTSKVQQQGLVSLSSEERRRLIIDPNGFVQESLSKTFPSYVRSVLKPSFDAHVNMGIYNNDAKTFQNFVANRILWDETMASAAAKFLLKNPDVQLVGLVGGDHVKTNHGIPAKIDRILRNLGFSNPHTASVALNPNWRIFSNSRKLVELEHLEVAQQKESASSEAEWEGYGWNSQQSRNHPFSDIVWFS
ncbi:hypothetical protein GUITHDRAFT_152654 [Guillardia theta CCMP2712]|uniref:Haem-binding uptake Tiki superfamily ChaN domain-containing protein n=2 Tax=Guillardia theta TaxID=55529 RepID=L1JAT1_GUITC|nr:hypothetical protein GUITHDRAFT_152654 [Guillardia theta CCMP2712]EKX45648.1 hypothetical protein GUITHDRAFT_152654 [Guillardia theta CCMP2712]|eukprot:XP_005832628.1 hypothetical protein GUITHDRAFT_152654 [Guillardia theta CCMP2712]